MKVESRYQNKKVLVVGLALSGFHAAKLLDELGAFVTVNDSKDLDQSPDAQELVASGIRVIAGHHPIELLDESFAFVIKNPGIPYSNPMIKRAMELGIPIYTEVEVAVQILEANLIAVTGTNGKTTTTTMIHEVLAHSREKGTAYKAGNIGIPASVIAQQATTEDDVVLELSSFQLMGIETLRPHIAVITNITEAHLDYHGTREEYVAAKLRITENQTNEDYFVYNADQEELSQMATKSKATLVPFSRMKVEESGAYVDDEALYFRGERIMAVSELAVPGNHNIENALATIAVAKLQDVSNEVINEVLSAFSGVKHRLQYVATVDERKFYNDSKSTNVLAAKMALASFPTESVVLLAGGLDRGNGFEELVPSLGQVHAMVVFGETAEKLAEAGKIAGIKTIKQSNSVQTAVQDAFAVSNPNDVILLSPACASWDQYKNFEIRGDEFINAVHQLDKDTTK